MLFYGTNPELYNFHLELALIDREEAILRLNMLDQIYEEWKPRLKAGAELTEETMQGYFKAFLEDNKEAINDFEGRRKKVSESASQRSKQIRNSTVNTEDSKPTFKTVSLPNGIEMIVMETRKDCGDPNCLIHGKLGRRFPDLFL